MAKDEHNRNIIGGILALVVALAIVVAACGGGGDDQATEVIGSADTSIATDAQDGQDSANTATVRPTITPLPTPSPIPTSTALPTLVRATSTPTVTPQPERTDPTIRPPGDWDVDILRAKKTTEFVPVYKTKNGKEFNLQYTYLNGNKIDYPLLSPTYFGNDLVLMVLEGEPGDKWAKVQVPVRPSGTTAWVKTEFFDWSVSEHFVEIDVSTNMVRVWDGSELITETKAVTGSSGRPTPLFSAYIDEKVPDQGAAYGPWVLTLATFSESVNTFGALNGLPKIALHGTNNPAIIGQYASNGCIRVPNDVIRFIAEHVPVGTRVDIVRS